jgi:hypothetical protein
MVCRRSMGHLQVVKAEMRDCGAEMVELVGRQGWVPDVRTEPRLNIQRWLGWLIAAKCLLTNSRVSDMSEQHRRVLLQEST